MIDLHPLPEPPIPKRGRPANNRPAFLGPIKDLHEIPDAVACAACERLFIPWRGATYCSMACFLQRNRIASNGNDLAVVPRVIRRRNGRG